MARVPRLDRSTVADTLVSVRLTPCVYGLLMLILQQEKLENPGMSRSDVIRKCIEEAAEIRGLCLEAQ